MNILEKLAQVSKLPFESYSETGAKLDAVLLNAGAALYISEKAASISEGIQLAKSLIDSGAAISTLEKFIGVSNQ